LNNSNNPASTLFTASLLSRRKELNHHIRSKILSSVRPFDIHCAGDAIQGLRDAFNTFQVSSSLWKNLRRNAIAGAARQAEEWIRQGVSIVSNAALRLPEADLHGLPSVFFAMGDQSLMAEPSVAIMSSRRSRNITPHDGWLQVTKSLVSYAVDNGFTIVSSYGTSAYSLVSCLSKGFPTIVVCPGVLPFMMPSEQRAQFLLDYGDLFHFERTLFLSSFAPGLPPPASQRLVERDRMVAALSSTILAVDVRPKGNIETILHGAALRKVPIKVFPLPPKDIEAPGTSSPPRRVRSTHSEEREHFGESAFLFHYTRSCPGPWPGQSHAHYWRSLVDGSKDAGHTAMDTLARILTEGLIRGHKRLTRGSAAVVCFSECSPSRIERLITWRKGLIRWSFEPYAVAVRRDALLKLGAVKVTYGGEEVYKSLPDDQKNFFQIEKTSDREWSSEREWRIRGDLDLGAISTQDIVIIVADEEEVAVMQSLVANRVESLESFARYFLPDHSLKR
jgi:predicted Rossmann fold nucleotide-binding protein DprA/Smf involved in DNA uptake